MIYLRGKTGNRGLIIVPKSGGAIKKKFEDFDATKIFEDVFEYFVPKEDARKKACRCGELLRRLIDPTAVRYS